VKKILLVVAAVLALVALAVVAYRSNRVLVDGLPPKSDFAHQVDAYRAALAFAGGDASLVVPVAGTGSMRPYIPPAAAGLDPRRTIVAFVVMVPGATFADIRPGSLCSYEPADWPGERWLHQAAQKDAAGWIMTGLGNAHYESWMRVTAANFRGIVARTFTWPQRVLLP
jgi:hypothetical protein